MRGNNAEKSLVFFFFDADKKKKQARFTAPLLFPPYL
jgi:hypothetical protein